MYFKQFGVYSKYKNNKTMYNGILFDSQKEADCYEELVFKEKRGEITNLQRQVPFVLIEKTRYGRALKYIADFTYTDCETGKYVVADAKGIRTDVYKWKKRLLAEKYGIIIKEL